ncbi:AmmeMemoRadiSam system protein B [Ferrimonas balearica]|uniref:AmmeMemoRadiSam system protein B n=1 Tax=Ferrimonas balearica TaxID=44012 RepID=UPI001C998D95|nr:AmmeMemoRadiSam system protein B [Ferrimonas balearica]MBY5992600.1 AmmeMemoRadiSam system protein B [Ferrimonas balearica]
MALDWSDTVTLSPRIRPAAVAGYFYPGEATELARELDLMLSAEAAPLPRPPRALIVPHAGYLYSGAIAAKAYRTLADHPYRRVFLLGPAHTRPVEGIARPDWSHYATPLGQLALDSDALSALDANPWVSLDNLAHAKEHCLEVQLPFIQSTLADCPLVPLVVGDIPADALADLLAQHLAKQDLLIISTDLSHFLTLEQASDKDRHTVERILHFAQDLHGEDACGAAPLNGALRWAKAQKLSIQLLAKGSSAEANGDTDRVVGYAAFALC